MLGGKDLAWEHLVYGVRSAGAVDIFNPSRFPELQSLTHVYARHLTPELVRELMKDPEAWVNQLPSNCYFDISTVGMTGEKRELRSFGFFGKPGNIRIYDQPVNLE